MDSWPPATTIVGIAVQDCLIAKRHRAQARTAKLVNAPGRALDRDAGRDRGLTGRILALTRGQDLSHNDLGDLLAFDTGPLQRRLDGDLAQFVRRQIGESAVKGTDRRTRGADDDDVVLHE